MGAVQLPATGPVGWASDPDTDQGRLLVKFAEWEVVPREEATLRVRGPD